MFCACLNPGQSAIEGAQNDHAAKVQSVLADKQSHLEKVRRLFSQFGADDGVITYGMFQEKINDPAVKEYFATLGLDVYAAWTIKASSFELFSLAACRDNAFACLGVRIDLQPGCMVIF